MNIIKTSQNKAVLRISHLEWKDIGDRANWSKNPENHQLLQKTAHLGSKNVPSGVDYEKVHGHDKLDQADVGWFFHNYATHEDLNGFNHCEGGDKNPYKLKHFKKEVKFVHGIDKEYARGHGVNGEPQWFRFKKKLDDGWWNLDLGEKVDTDEVPERFK